MKSRLITGLKEEKKKLRVVKQKQAEISKKIDVINQQISGLQRLKNITGTIREIEIEKKSLSEVIQKSPYLASHAEQTKDITNSVIRDLNATLREPEETLIIIDGASGMRNLNGRKVASS